MQEFPSLEDRLAEYLDTPGSELPVFDRTALLVHQEGRRQDPDTETILALISQDQALVAEVLKLANSSFYSGIKKITRIQDAMLRIGLREIVNCVMMATQRRNYTAQNPFLQQFLPVLWRHSVACAHASQWLAKRCELEEMAPEAFIAGLVHDIGKLFVLKVIVNVHAKDRNAPRMTKAVVEDFLDALHTDWGYRLQLKWNLPIVFADICRDHHVADPQPDKLLAVVRLANLTCRKLGIGLHEDRNVLLGASWEAQLLKLGDIALAELEIAVEDYLLRGEM